MKKVYVLSVNNAPQYDDNVDFEGVYQSKEDAISDGFDLLKDNRTVIENYKDYCDDCKYEGSTPVSFNEYVTTNDTLMIVDELPVRLRSAKEVRENA